ncbi:Encoded by [Rhizoctonia solani]|uniref:Encoded by n=1 Tax=Rhizoctonia solani TaxID=456999 RepID=A0A8H7I7C3_9AGAM|nr:Encoded by [Rhizoctonia solani]
MAGTGKTAIAYSLCKELEGNGQLGASFFCHRASAEYQDVGRILPTISHQLAQKFYSFRSTLCRILGDNPNISRRTISVQFEYLIKLPLLEARNMLPNGLIVVVDGLDECTDSRTMKVLSELLVEQAATLPLKIFLTSRPEAIISESFTDCYRQAIMVLHLHDIEAESVTGDIRTYLCVALAKVNLPGEQIQKLTERAGVLFIYAVTLARYILGGVPGSITSSRLSSVLAGGSGPINKQNQDIYRLYKAILDQTFEDETLERGEINTIKDVLWTVACAMEPVAESTLAVLSNVNSEQISSALRPLQSVLHVSTSKSVVSALHSSFLEFLQSDLAGPLRCDYASHNKLLATQCFAIIERQLRFDICSLEVPYRFDNDVQGFSRHARKSVPPELFYAFQYWAYHLQSSRSCDQFVLCLDEFFRKQLMFWVEALNLKRFINRGPRVLIEALKWLQKNGNSPEILELQDFIRDACSFTTAFAVNPVCRSTPHLYLSMLPLIPVQNRVRANYRSRSPGILWLNGTTMSRREGVALATWEADCGVTTVVYSPDSMRIAYGFNSLAFSPDGARLISSSRDRTIRMWDTRTGAALEFCKSYAQDIPSVAFSPDGTLWHFDPRPLENHTMGVTVIIFSPDSTKFASGSYDRTIRVWLTNADGATLGPTHAFKGHTAGILAIAFSPDGDSLVSGSLDRTIRIWNSANGTPLSKPFEGHTDAVSAVVFSCDGTKAISGSWDCTVRVWNAIDSAQISGPFTGHAQGVTCLSICPNGGSIVSGSWDGSTHFWDPHSNFTRDFDDHGHTQAITCVQFSPDGDSIISASEDSLVCIWDIETGDRRIKTNKGHIGKANSVTFSPDGRQFLTGGDDSTGAPKTRERSGVLRFWEPPR